MNWIEIVRVAVRALVRNKVRSLLTTLGIIIGVAAVIATVAIGEGARAAVEKTFAAMGVNLLVIVPGAVTSGGAHMGWGSSPTLTWDDAAAIKSELGSVRYVSPQQRSVQQLVGDEQNWSAQLHGVAPEYFDIRDWGLQFGRRFTQTEYDAGAKVMLVGQVAAKGLFGAGVDPVGRVVRVKNTPFEVIGVLAFKGQSAMGMDFDDTAFIPATTYSQKVQGGMQKYLSGPILVSTVSAAATPRAMEQITQLLRERHRIQPGADDDFSIRNLAEVASAQQDSAKTMSLLLLSVAAISLLVGGIGIMNIMLVSVTERTREIGIRMAVGAKPNAILAQFVVESLALSTVGGLIGIGIGVGLSRHLASQFDWPSILRPDVPFLAMGVSSAVGLVFGLYPALKASRLDPIEALRYE